MSDNYLQIEDMIGELYSNVYEIKVDVQAILQILIASKIVTVAQIEEWREIVRQMPRYKKFRSLLDIMNAEHEKSINLNKTIQDALSGDPDAVDELKDILTS